MGGALAFGFRSDGRIYINATSINKAGEAFQADISDIVAVTPSDALYPYMIKMNRASTEYWVWGQLVAIIQYAPSIDDSSILYSDYVVRTGAPYYLAQLRGQAPCFLPAVIEIICARQQDIGKRSNIQLQHIYITDGDPAPPRTLHPYTDEESWAGTVVAAGTLSSDRIPVAGYEKRFVQFRATVQGDLEIYGDYGDDSLDFLESFAVAAGDPVTYPIEADPLWLQLVYDPDTYPATVTRARVLMR